MFHHTWLNSSWKFHTSLTIFSSLPQLFPNPSLLSYPPKFVSFILIPIKCSLCCLYILGCVTSTHVIHVSHGWLTRDYTQKNKLDSASMSSYQRQWLLSWEGRRAHLPLWAGTWSDVSFCSVHDVMASALWSPGLCFSSSTTASPTWSQRLGKRGMTQTPGWAESSQSHPLPLQQCGYSRNKHLSDED